MGPQPVGGSQAGTPIQGTRRENSMISRTTRTTPPSTLVRAFVRSIAPQVAALRGRLRRLPQTSTSSVDGERIGHGNTDLNLLRLPQLTRVSSNSAGNVRLDPAAGKWITTISFRPHNRDAQSVCEEGSAAMTNS